MSIKIINEHQRQAYLNYEKNTVQKLIAQYSGVLKKIETQIREGGGNSLKIIDLGGGAGFFASALHDFLSDIKCEIYVIDTTEYPTWLEYSDKITFIKDSADNLSKLFAENTFDLVFANRVFHHFIRDSWNTSVDGMANIMQQIVHILKKDGFFCIIDYIYNGFLYDKATSKIIYTLTSVKFSLLAAIIRKLGANTAGVGVCYLSKKMWMKLFAHAGLQIQSFVEAPEYPFAWYKRMVFLCKNLKEDNVFVCQKNNSLVMLK